MRGNVKFYNEKNSYGFILCKEWKDGKDDIYFHKDDILPQGATLKKGEMVSFDISETSRGSKAQAVMRISNRGKLLG